MRADTWSSDPLLRSCPLRACIFCPGAAALGTRRWSRHHTARVKQAVTARMARPNPFRVDSVRVSSGLFCWPGLSVYTFLTSHPVCPSHCQIDFVLGRPGPNRIQMFVYCLLTRLGLRSVIPALRFQVAFVEVASYDSRVDGGQHLVCSRVFSQQAGPTFGAGVLEL